MSAIIFDALVPATYLAPLTSQFERLASRVTELEGAHVTVTATQPVQLDPEVLAQLRELGSGEPTRFHLDISGQLKSLNQTAMLFSRLLTPQADLPAEPVLLQNESAHELDAYFPWTVDIQP